MWSASVPELTPREVGTPFPVSSRVAPDAYTYDYIIVGGGTAGCALASRLTEDPSVSVLLIEQGPVNDTYLARIPLISGAIYAESGSYSASKWWSQPLPHANNRFLEIIRGEALGGTSRINGMLYTRGTPGDYNRWKDLGNDGWGYDDLEPYFVKSEKTHSYRASTHRGTDGLWQNRNFAASPYKITEHIDRAVHKIGIQRVQDSNSPDIPAAYTGILDIIQDKKFYRNSTFLAFLPPQLAQERKSRLKICPNTVVCRVETNRRGDAIHATGVHFESTNSRKADFRYVAKARREVVVCAGALGSPHVLLLSGLGPKAHLEEKGIPVIHDLPAVGGYLADHMAVPISIQVPVHDSLHQLEVSPLTVILELIKYIATGQSVFSRPFQNVASYFPTQLLDSEYTISTANNTALDARVPSNRPDIEFMHITSNCADIDVPPGMGVFTLLVTLIRPRSTGAVRLATTNPRAKPDVDLGFLSNPADYAPLRAGIRVAMKVFENVRAQGYPVMGDLHFPDGGASADDAALDAFIRAHLRTCFHYTSTCRMGADSDGEQPSVVDAELRVHGVRGLRVCDASVFPEIIGSHTMAPSVAVAEKCADLIKAAWR